MEVAPATALARSIPTAELAVELMEQVIGSLFVVMVSFCFL